MDSFKCCKDIIGKRAQGEEPKGHLQQINELSVFIDLLGCNENNMRKPGSYQPSALSSMLLQFEITSSKETSK